MQCVIKINMGNEAFTDDPESELQRIFRELSEMSFPATAGTHRGIRDINGNTCGALEIKPITSPVHSGGAA